MKSDKGKAPLSKRLQLPRTAVYTLTNEESGFADGVITVTVDKSNAATDIIPFWANENGILKEYRSLYAFRITGETTDFTIGPNILIPRDATKLFLYAKDFFSGEITREPFVIDLPQGVCQKEFGEPVLEFQVISDLHMADDDDPYIAILKDIVTVSPKSAGLFLNGDVTQSGADAEYRRHRAAHASVEGAPACYMSIGNHDFYQAKAGLETRGQARERFLRYARCPDGSSPKDQHYHFWLAGYHFVFLGDDEPAGDYLSSAFQKETMAWLRKTLAENRDPLRPVFLFHHQPLQNTVAGSRGEYDGFTGADGVARYAVFTGLWGKNADRLREVLGDFPEVILFSGHQHITLGYPNTMRAADDTLPAVFNTASASQVASIRDHVKTKENGSEGYYISVYADQILVRGRDFKTKQWIPSAQFCLNV